MANKASFLEKCKQTLKKLDNYRLAILLGIPLYLGALIFLLATGTSLLPIWFLSLFFIPSFIGRSISGTSYLVRLLDFFKIPTLLNFVAGEDSQAKPVGKAEKYLTLIGCLTGIGLSVFYLITQNWQNLLSLLQPLGDILAPALFSLGIIGGVAGLCNRIGACIDNSKLSSERKVLIAGIIIGLALGIVLLFCPPAAVAGITSFVTLGANLPVFISAPLFVLNFTSMLVSAMDFWVRSWNYLQYLCKTGADAEHKNRVEERIHEYRGSFVGTILGFAIGSLIIAGLIVTQPLFVGLVGVVTGFIVMVACASTLGGLSQRIGRLFDGFKISNTEPSAEIVEEITPENKEDLIETINNDYRSVIEMTSSIGKNTEKEDSIVYTYQPYETAPANDVKPIDNISILSSYTEHNSTYTSSELLSKYGFSASARNNTVTHQSNLAFELEYNHEP